MHAIAASIPTFLDLPAARQFRDGLATLLRAERAAAADFLLALSDFDRRRGWEPLGHASLFAFLHVELGLSKGGASTARGGDVDGPIPAHARVAAGHADCTPTLLAWTIDLVSAVGR